MKKKTLIGAIGAAVLIAGCAVTPAYAESSELSDSQLLSLLQQHGVDTTSGLVDSGEAPAEGAASARATTDTPSGEDSQIVEEVYYTADVAVPASSDGDISVKSQFGDIEISLPDPGSDSRSEVSDRVSSFTHGDGSISAPIVRDNGVQVITVISSPDAPETYSYEVGLDGGRLQLEDNGAVSVYAADGSFVGGFAAPWATDNTGAAVPTSYSVSDGVLTQTVEHQNQDVAYPIVADPNYSSGPFTKSTVSAYSASNPGYKVSAWLSASGRVVHVAQPGVFSAQGWGVLKANHPGYVLSGGKDRPTMKQQWDCHIVGGLAEWDSWDLETGRPSNPNWGTRIGTVWPPALICNW
ncbi:hypothetical protein ACTJI8_20270 [Microbacterium sp. 22303]|uniref:hypothetical protein n=1 Tax=Microbacterium sp. 22303 TaxID=3453905 RepID=UPI003F86A40B